MSDPNVILPFVERLTVGAPAGAWLSVTRLPRARTWCTPAARPDLLAALAVDDAANYFIGVGAFDRKLDRGVRGSARDVRFLMGLAVDVDIDHPVAHRHRPGMPLAESVDEAVAAVRALPVAPTMVWNTGHGVQAVVVFDPAVDALEHDLVPVLRRWKATLVETSQATMVAFDDTADAVRLVRLPGTVNVKVPGDPRPVTMLTDDGPAYGVDELLPLLAADTPPPPPRPAAVRPPDVDGFDDPVDRWCRALAWTDILAPHGWEPVSARGPVTYWRRPGKATPGWSASTGWTAGDDDVDLLHVFSDAAHPFAPGGWYSKPRALALLRGVPVGEVLSAIRARRWSRVG